MNVNEIIATEDEILRCAQDDRAGAQPVILSAAKDLEWYLICLSSLSAFKKEIEAPLRERIQ